MPFGATLHSSNFLCDLNEKLLQQSPLNSVLQTGDDWDRTMPKYCALWGLVPQEAYLTGHKATLIAMWIRAEESSQPCRGIKWRVERGIKWRIKRGAKENLKRSERGYLKHAKFEMHSKIKGQWKKKCSLKKVKIMNYSKFEFRISIRKQSKQWRGAPPVTERGSPATELAEWSRNDEFEY